MRSDLGCSRDLSSAICGQPGSWIVASAVAESTCVRLPDTRGTGPRWGRGVRFGLPAMLVLAMLSPTVAQAHGPVAPVATSYLARVRQLPAGLDAKVIDGYLRLWLRVPADETVEVLDYRGAPYLRFARSGVYVNENSEMYDLNYIVPLPPPADLSRGAPARWERVSGGREYNWHDARIGALADTALAPGTTYVGRWSIPILVDGRLRAISGGIWYARSPSPAWFWPIVVLLACLPAALRLRRRPLDEQLARVLAIVALLTVAVGVAGRELHGRPTIEVLQLVVLGIVLVLVGGALVRVLRRRQGLILELLVAFAALEIGWQLAPTLVHGFVLIALPAFVARVAAVLGLGVGAGLLVLVLRLAELVP